MLVLCRSHLPVVSSAGCPERCCPADLQSVRDQSYAHARTDTHTRAGEHTLCQEVASFFFHLLLGRFFFIILIFIL